MRLPSLPSPLSPAMGRLVVCAALAAGCGTGRPSETPAPVIDPATSAARDMLRRESTLDVRTIPERAIAVPPFQVYAGDTTLAPLGYGLADLLMTDLAFSAQLVVVDRSRVDAMLRELRLAQAGRVDSAQAPRVGRLLGARHLIVGSLSDRGGMELGIDTRLANVVDGSLTGALSARASLAAILDAEKALAYRVFAELGVTLTPQERANIDQRPTANVTALLAYSRGVRDEAFGQYEAAAANYRAALSADPGFRAARGRLEQAQTAQTSAAATPAPKGPPGAPSALGGGAAALAAGAINPSPLSTLATGGSASASQQQTSQADRGVQAQRQPVYTTVIINVKQLP
jgi:TolB-like protein